MTTTAAAATTTQLGEVTLRGRAFQVSEVSFPGTEIPSSVALTGPRGSYYIMGEANSTGVRRLTNIRSGQELIVRGNAVRVVMFGGIIEEVKL